MIPVLSSAIAAVGYDPNTKRMQIRFTSGGITYTYCGVPQSVYDGLMSAPSKGTYFDRVIRDRYQC
ncbi:KTSC domain-containing protein [Alcaligenes faecalis]|uniref:KTSC domain-containing protein n=1 Tax=Alcaligenes ammonioxydans TaxID=2582914 RepID=A0ABX8SVB6_9BURK|nr:KTSC domain-containing protein [Alcaligenes ammonioxydans]QXX78985.1 KTSC domain-containing protein [Alcaligenes ammonioxydans]